MELFAINMLKQCVLDWALNSSNFLLVEKAVESPESKEVDGKLEGPIAGTRNHKRKTIENERSVNNSTISVSQATVAVAGLHKRCRLERKVKALWDPAQVTAYQRMVEHKYMSKRANDERQKRPDYRTVIKYDGLLWRWHQNLEPNRIKTREELLAEERDYKRQRMSYRGKKMKRSMAQAHSIL